ncbi:MAG: deoxyribose-phosphate aldolase [Anaerolineae bacterium]|nr:deoxyribose-phosphate aldolase [Anaerolineae bacterium]
MRASDLLAQFRDQPLAAAAIQTNAPRLSAHQLAGMIDHTALKPETTPDMIAQLCAEAQQYGMASVCVNSVYVAQCRAALAGSECAVCSVVGFPLGASLSAVKAFEAEQCIDAGASEIDMVLSVGALKAGRYDLVSDDIAIVARTCHARSAICKVIVEACLLSDREKVIACLLVVEAGADFVKTSTGFSTGGATLEDVALMRRVVGPEIGVKAAGGIRSYEMASAMVAAGASRIGASSSIAIIEGAPA